MNNIKNNYYNYKILNILLLRGKVSIEQISKEIGLTDKTTRNKITLLSNYLNDNNLGIIKKKQRIGVWLESTEEQKDKITMFISENKNIDLVQDNQNRKDIIIKKLFKTTSNNILTMLSLSKTLYVSIPTVNSILKQSIKWFNTYNIQVITQRNKGIYLESTEYNYRVALKNYIFQNGVESIEKNLSEFALGVDIKKIRSIIIQIENDWRLQFSENSFLEILIFICLSISRKGIPFDFLVHEKEKETLQSYNEYSFATSLYEKIEQEFKFKVCKSEIDFLSINILGSKLLGENFFQKSSDYIIEYDKNINLFVKTIIEIIGNIINVNLSSDKLLFDCLLSHMRPAIFRLRYGSGPLESLSEYIKNEFKQVFRATWATSYLFEEFYNVNVTEDELVYIALYIQSALERRMNPINAVLITQMGRAHSQLICEKIKKTIPDIKSIKIIGGHDFKISDYKNFSIIFTMNEISKNHIFDKRIIYIDKIITDKYIQNIKGSVENLLNCRINQNIKFDVICHQLFDPDLIFIHPNIENKEQLLSNMTKKLVDRGFVTNKYLQCVLDREKATTTSIGGGVSIPHGNTVEVNESKVAIAILKEPILWHGDFVDVVFLLSIKMTNPTEIHKIQQFYKQFIFLSEDDEKMNIVRSMKTEIDLYKYLIG